MIDLGFNLDDVGSFLTDNVGLSTFLPIESMLTLGGYKFSIKTAAYQALKRVTEYRWIEMQRLNTEPSHQYIGPGGETIDLEGTIYPQFRGGLRQLDLMRYEAQKGRPLMLISGHGFAFGRWFILSISEGRTIFMKDGTPRKIEFSMTIKKYGDDRQRGLLGVVQKIGKLL